MIVNRYVSKTDTGNIQKVKGTIIRILPSSVLHVLYGLYKGKAKDGEESFTEKFYKKYKQDAQTPLFETIQIETFNRCNGICPFCPVNKNVDTRKPIKMTDALFNKIIRELAEMKYTGRLALFSNNEPLLDKKLAERARIAKTACPDAFVYIYTNGSLINVENFKEMVPWLDQIFIDNYNDDLAINDNLKPIVRLCEENEILNKKVVIYLRKINEVLKTRGGQSPNNDKREQRTYPCFLPFNQFIIRPDGKVSLCCCDALGKMTLGDVSKNTLLEVWFSEDYEKIRRQVFENIADIELCRYCDSKYRK